MLRNIRSTHFKMSGDNDKMNNSTNVSTTAPEPRSLLGYHRQLSPNAAVKVSPLCLGGMSFGTAWTNIMGSCDKEASFELLDYFYSRGGNFVDT